jgi:hypothetical protein
MRKQPVPLWHAKSLRTCGTILCKRVKAAALGRRCRRCGASRFPSQPTTHSKQTGSACWMCAVLFSPPSNQPPLATSWARLARRAVLFYVPSNQPPLATSWARLAGGTARVFRWRFALELSRSAIELAAFAPLEARACVCPMVFLSVVHFLTG